MTAHTITTVTSRWRQITIGALLGTAVATGLAFGPAPAANAQPPQLTQAQAFFQCRAAGHTFVLCCVGNGGIHTPKDGTRKATCKLSLTKPPKRVDTTAPGGPPATTPQGPEQTITE